MLSRADKAKNNKNETVKNNCSKQQSNGDTAFQLVDNRPEAVAHKRMQERVGGSVRVKRLMTLQKMVNNTSLQKKVTQLQNMTQGQMRSAGFRYEKGGRWQYDESGYHVSAIRSNGAVVHFHVVGRWKGKDYNRLDFNEGNGNVWAETIIHQDRPDDIDAMRDIARRTAPFFGGNIN